MLPVCTIIPILFLLAILVSAYPEMAPFMSDEGMLSTPGVEATDSTIAEYNNYSEQLCKKAKFLQEKGMSILNR